MTLDVRQAADIQSLPTTGGRFPDTEIWRLINQSIARLYTMLAQADSSQYLSQYTFTTENDTASYDLPADFWVSKGVTITLSSGNTVRCSQYMPREKPWLDSVANWYNFGMPVQYRFEGSAIVFSPSPAGEYSVTLDYVQAPQHLTTGVDTFNGIAGFERWIILDAAIKCKQKDSLDASMLAQEKAEVEAWIMSMATSRDVGESQRIQDVQSDYHNLQALGVWR